MTAFNSHYYVLEMLLLFLGLGIYIDARRRLDADRQANLQIVSSSIIAEAAEKVCDRFRSEYIST